MASDPPTLPQELIDHVIGILAESGVAQLENVSLASRSLSVSCQPHQFKRLTIATYPTRTMKNTLRKISVFKRNPELLQHARILTMDVNGYHCNESISISNADNVSDLSFVLGNLSEVQQATLTWSNASLDGDQSSPTMTASFFGFLTCNPLQHLSLRTAHVPSSFLDWLPPTLVSLSTFDCWITSQGTRLDPPRTSGSLQAMTRLRFYELVGTFNLALLKQASSVAPAIQSVHISLDPMRSAGYAERVFSHREILTSLPSTVKELLINIDLTEGHWHDPQKVYRDVFSPGFQPNPHPSIRRFDFAVAMADLADNVPQLTELAVHYLLNSKLSTLTLRYYFVIRPFSETESGIVDGDFLEARGPSNGLFPRQMYLAQLDDHLSNRNAVPGLRRMNVVASILTYSNSERTCPEKVTVDPATRAKLTGELEDAFCRTRERVQGERGGEFNVYLTTGMWHWHYETRRVTLDMAPDLGSEYPLGAIEDYGLENM